MLQDTLNRFGGLMSEQKQLMEQRERFYEQILSSVTSGIIVLDEDMKVVQTNPAAARLLGLPVLSTLQQLDRYGTEVPHVFRTLGAGERCNIQFSTSKGEVQLLVRASVMQLGDRTVRILALNDIRNELDAKELDSWIKLTRVLTHEIMNSIAPISSLSETFLKRSDVIGTPLYDGIRAIHETSTGLISFVDSYRKFSSLQKPSPEPFYLLDLLHQVEGLTLVPENIALTLQIEPAELMLYADPNLIRQVLINLIKMRYRLSADIREEYMCVHIVRPMSMCLCMLAMTVRRFRRLRLNRYSCLSSQPVVREAVSDSLCHVRL